MHVRRRWRKGEVNITSYLLQLNYFKDSWFTQNDRNIYINGRTDLRINEFINESDFQLRIPWQFHLQSISNIYKRDSLKGQAVTIFPYDFLYIDVCMYVYVCTLFTEECRSRAFCNTSCRQSHIHARASMSTVWKNSFT